MTKNKKRVQNIRSKFISELTSIQNKSVEDDLYMLLAKQLWTFRPSKVDLIFACKTFFAGMVALYIAFLLDLPYPMWAIGTVFIIANPYAGMVSSKAIYRLAGTFFGAVIALIMLPHLINTPLIFTIVLAAWVGICLYISMLDRTPRSYMFMLAGYTCVMVATNVIHTLDNAPLSYSMFDIALGRVLEISIAVIVTSVVFSTIFPLHIGAAIQQRVQKTLTDTTDVFIQLFQDHPQAKTATQLIAVINRDTNDLHGLAVHLSYEKGKLQGMTKPLQEMLHQFSLVLVNLVAISQRLQQLDQFKVEIKSPLQPVMTNIVLFLKQPIDLSNQEKNILPATFDEAFDKLILHTKSSQAKVVIESLKMDIRHFVQNAYYVKYIWALMQSGERKIPEFIQPITTSYPSLHRDHGVALRGALAAVVSILVAFTIWIYSGWEYGFMMAQMAAIISCILTALDNPIPTLKVFLRGTVYATIIVFIYLFFVLPDVKAFWQLAVVLAPVMIYAVCLIPHPPLTGLGLPVAINVIMALNLQNHYQISPIPSIDAAIAGLVGPIIPVLALYYIRAMSPDITAKRLIESHYQAMREAIHIPFGNQFNIHLRSMLDRIGLLNTKPVESQGIKELMNQSLIETSAIADLSRLDELAHSIEMPIEIRQKLVKLQLLFAQEFQWQEKIFLNTSRHADDIFTCLDDLQDTSQIMQNEHLKQRLWISLNNVRYSICHASTRSKQLQQEVSNKGSVI